MFITLTQLQNEEATTLQSVVDNTGGKLYIALRELHYEVGYHNVGSSSVILWRSVDTDRPRRITVPPGLYTFEQLSKFFMEAVPGLTLKIVKATGLIKLSIPGSDGEIKLSGDIRRILGIDEKGWFGGEYEGDSPAEVIPHKWFYIHLDQLSTSSNHVDGAPSTLFAIVPAAAGGTVDITPPYPMYKKLQIGHIHQLNMRVLDEKGVIVKNRQRPIAAVLEIRENA